MPYVIRDTGAEDHKLQLRYDPAPSMELIRAMDNGATQSDPSRQPPEWNTPLTPELIASFPNVVTFHNDNPSPKSGVRDWLQMGSAGAPLVSPPIREIVNSLEPGVHLFRPIRLVDLDDPEINLVYYQLIVSQKIDAIDERHSKLRSKLGAKGAITDFDRVVLLDSAVRGRHIWRGMYINTLHQYFISDDLHDAFKANDVSGWKVWPRLQLTSELTDRPNRTSRDR